MSAIGIKGDDHGALCRIDFPQGVEHYHILRAVVRERFAGLIVWR